MKKFFKRILKFFGLYTYSELYKMNMNFGESMNNIGELTAYSVVRQKMEELYGLPADEWCKQMYEFIKKKTKEF